jgi:hypothetical protein
MVLDVNLCIPTRYSLECVMVYSLFRQYVEYAITNLLGVVDISLILPFLRLQPLLSFFSIGKILDDRL